MNLHSQNILLRAVEPTDIDILYKWENDTSIWNVSNTQTPFSRNVLEHYVLNAQLDIYSTKQLRLMISSHPQPLTEGAGSRPVGTIDLFDFEPNHLRAGIGILISENTDKRNGYATEALSLLIPYCFETLNLHQLYCNIITNNEPSILLFQKFGFEITGIKKQWNRIGSKWQDELLLQKIK